MNTKMILLVALTLVATVHAVPHPDNRMNFRDRGLACNYWGSGSPTWTNARNRNSCSHHKVYPSGDTLCRWNEDDNGCAAAAAVAPGYNECRCIAKTCDEVPCSQDEYTNDFTPIQTTPLSQDDTTTVAQSGPVQGVELVATNEYCAYSVNMRYHGWTNGQSGGAQACGQVVGSNAGQHGCSSTGERFMYQADPGYCWCVKERNQDCTDRGSVSGTNVYSQDAVETSDEASLTEETAPESVADVTDEEEQAPARSEQEQRTAKNARRRCRRACNRRHEENTPRRRCRRRCNHGRRMLTSMERLAEQTNQ